MPPAGEAERGRERGERVLREGRRREGAEKDGRRAERGGDGNTEERRGREEGNRGGLGRVREGYKTYF